MRSSDAGRSAWARRAGAAAALALAFSACKGNSESPTGAGASSSGRPGATPENGASGGVVGAGTPGGAGAFHGGCRIFPTDNPWNRRVDADPVDTALMGSVMPSMALGTRVHPDWGTVTDNYGIPITVGKAAAPAPITWNSSYGESESDKLPCDRGPFCYPIPFDAKIEGGSGASATSDRHVLFVANDGAPDHCVVYELYNTQNPSGGGFTAASGAIWKLDSNALRTEGWTSADAAGLPVLAGLVRLEEIKRGEINHALRFTMSSSRQAYIHPATHAAGDDNAARPPMGLRVRLKASFDDSGFTGATKVVTTAMKRYGMILADNGSSWYVTGDSDNGWAPEMEALLSNLATIKGADFEIVKTGEVIIAR